jgi:hypothetical protein
LSHIPFPLPGKEKRSRQDNRKKMNGFIPTFIPLPPAGSFVQMALRKPCVSAPCLSRAGNCSNCSAVSRCSGPAVTFPRKSFFSLFASDLHPLSDCSLAHTLCLCALFLAPSELCQIPRSPSAPLLPISSVFISSFHFLSFSYYSKQRRDQ